MACGDVDIKVALYISTHIFSIRYRRGERDYCLTTQPSAMELYVIRLSKGKLHRRYMRQVIVLSVYVKFSVNLPVNREGMDHKVA